MCGASARWGSGSGWGSEAGWGSGFEGGAVCRRGVGRGAVSRPFPVSALLRALQRRGSQTVYVDVDSAGYLVPGGGGGGEGGAALCVGAALAPNVHAHTALLTAPAPVATPADMETLLQLRVSSERAPHEALRVWVDERLRAALRLPHLALTNIRGENEYACHLCSARFPEPNPLKVHLFLGCAEPAPRRFWRRVAARLLRPAPPAPSPPVAPHPARLEALAAEWGRAAGGGGRGGHACVYCGKLYSRKYGLKIHIRTHTGYRPLRCRHCARAFADPSNLNKHVRLHAARGGGGGEGDAGLACRVCGKALARRRDLERHLRTHALPELDPRGHASMRPSSCERTPST